MIDILMILGGAAIGGAIGLLGRYHDNKVKREYERGYKVGYQLGKSVYSKDDENIFTIDIRKDYNFKFGNHLFDAQQIQSIAEHCQISISFRRYEYLKLDIWFGKYHEHYVSFLLCDTQTDEENEQAFKDFLNKYLEVENEQ